MRRAGAVAWRAAVLEAGSSPSVSVLRGLYLLLCFICQFSTSRPPAPTNLGPPTSSLPSLLMLCSHQGWAAAVLYGYKNAEDPQDICSFAPHVTSPPRTGAVSAIASPPENYSVHIDAAAAKHTYAFPKLLVLGILAGGWAGGPAGGRAGGRVGGQAGGWADIVDFSDLGLHCHPLPPSQEPTSAWATRCAAWWAES